MAEIWSKFVPGVKAMGEVTGTSVENVKLADKGETVVSLIMGDVAYQAHVRRGGVLPSPSPGGDPQLHDYAYSRSRWRKV
jgi:hypothetical protein